MNRVARSAGCKAVLLALLVLPAVQCGDDSQVVEINLQCVVEGFEGGTFEFSVDGVDDQCLGGLIGELFPDNPTYGPVALPGFDQVPATVEFPFGPPIGTVTVTITAGEDSFLVTLTDPPHLEIELPGIGTLYATLSGRVCPILLPDQILATTKMHLNPLPPLIPLPCDVVVSATGRPAEQE